MTNKYNGSQDFDVGKYEKEKQLREVGGQAVWSLSSCKPGRLVRCPSSDHVLLIVILIPSPHDRTEPSASLAIYFPISKVIKPYCFSLGYGIDQLRETNLATYWQSDDATPHYINVQFKRKMLIADICLYMDYKNDESYTPNKLVVQAFADIVFELLQCYRHYYSIEV